MHPSHNPQRLVGRTALAAVLVGSVALMLITLAQLRSSPGRLWGDEGTFVAMTTSLVRDGDLVFGEADAEWARAREPGPPVTVILQRTERGITYSKPPLYALISAPFALVFGEAGLVIANGLALALAMALAWRFLRSLGPGPAAAWTLATFLFCSVLPAYLGWKMSDLLQAAFTLAGLLLALGGRGLEQGGQRARTPNASLASAVVGGLLLGAAVSMRFTAAALAAAAVAALLVDRRLQRGLVVGSSVVLMFLAASGVSQALLGTPNPYKAVRSSFNADTGYPVGERAEEALQSFTTRPATQSATWRPAIDARRSAYSTLYFFVGRHTGLLAYFPAALVLLLHLLRRPDPPGLALLAGVAAVALFYLLWMPQNYFGGSTFLGNRYFLSSFPVLLVALRRLPSTRLLSVAWLLGLSSWGSAVHSVLEVRALDRTSQSHSRSGIFRRLPFESTAQRIDGTPERFWDEDYVRFLDPFSRPQRWSFRLHSHEPAAEMLVATDWPGDRLLFLVSPASARVTLEVTDRRGTTLFAVPRPPPEPRGLIEVATGPTWRRHAFWWRPGKLYRVRTLRFSLQADQQDPTSAVVRYLGRGRELAPLSAELIDAVVPSRVVAGTSSTLQVRLRNTGRGPWKTETLLPVRLRYRLWRAGVGDAVASERLELPARVPSGQILELPLELRWPGQGGDYTILLELVRPAADLLGEQGRLSLLSAEIEVLSPSSPDSPEP